MHPADIKALLEKAGVTQTAIAQKLAGRSRSGAAVTAAAVHLVICGKSRSQAIAKAISAAVARPVSQLWPGKYPAIEQEQSPPTPRPASRAAVAPRRRAAGSAR